MSSGSFSQVKVRCPFYRSDDGKSCVVCEGIAEDSSLVQRFRHKRGFDRQMRDYCAGRYTQCEVHRMVLVKYSE